MTIDWRILTGITVVLIAAFAWFLIANADLRASAAIARTENAALRIDNANFKNKIEQQNRAVAAFRAAALERMRRAAQARKNAKKIAARAIEAAASLEKQQAVGDACKASHELIDSYIEKNR